MALHVEWDRWERLCEFDAEGWEDIISSDFWTYRKHTRYRRHWHKTVP